MLNANKLKVKTRITFFIFDIPFSFLSSVNLMLTTKNSTVGSKKTRSSYIFLEVRHIKAFQDL